MGGMGIPGGSCHSSRQARDPSRNKGLTSLKRGESEHGSLGEGVPRRGPTGQPVDGFVSGGSVEFWEWTPIPTAGSLSSLLGWTTGEGVGFSETRNENPGTRRTPGGKRVNGVLSGRIDGPP